MPGTRRLIALPLARQHLRVLTSLIVALVLAWALGRYTHVLPQTPQDEPSYYQDRTATVVGVVDGDTLDVDLPDTQRKKPYTRIRLRGVDTPETRHPTVGEMYFGKEATAFTRQLTLGQPLQIKLDPQEDIRDRYDRLLAYLYLPDGTMLNERLISGGFGYADERFKHVYKHRFLSLQKQAQRGRIGLWEKVQPDQWPDWYRQRHDRELKAKTKARRSSGN